MNNYCIQYTPISSLFSLLSPRTQTHEPAWSTQTELDWVIFWNGLVLGLPFQVNNKLQDLHVFRVLSTQRHSLCNCWSQRNSEAENLSFSSRLLWKIQSFLHKKKNGWKPTKPKVKTEPPCELVFENFGSLFLYPNAWKSLLDFPLCYPVHVFFSWKRVTQKI